MENEIKIKANNSHLGILKWLVENKPAEQQMNFVVDDGIVPQCVSVGLLPEYLFNIIFNRTMIAMSSFGQGEAYIRTGLWILKANGVYYLTN